MPDLIEMYRKFWDEDFVMQGERATFESRLNQIRYEGIITLELEPSSVEVTQKFNGVPVEGTSCRTYIKAHLALRHRQYADIEFGVPSFLQTDGYRFVSSGGLKLATSWYEPGSWDGDEYAGDFRELDSRLFARELAPQFINLMGELKGQIIALALNQAVQQPAPA